MSADSTAQAHPMVSPLGATSSWKTAIKEGGLSRPQDLRIEWELHQNDRRDSLHHQKREGGRQGEGKEEGGGQGGGEGERTGRGRGGVEASFLEVEGGLGGGFLCS